MSKAVTNEEVEDVLSSIRRLVSEDKRPLAGLRSPAPQPAKQPEHVAEEPAELSLVDEQPADTPFQETAPDRFVLTPALRVMDAAEEQGDTAPLDLGAVTRQTWSEDDQGDEAETATQENDGPLMLFPTADAPKLEHRTEGDDPAMDAVDALVHNALESQTEAEDDYRDYSDESYWEDDAETDSPADYDIEAQEQLRKEEEHKFHEGEAQSEPEVAEQPESDPQVAQAEADLEELQGETDNISVLPLTAKIAALEAAVDGINQEWEPDGTEEADLTPADATAMAWEDDIDLDARGAPVVEMVEDTAETAQSESEGDTAASTSGVAGDDQLLDEAALRELVSEIVREELQGALGERITRNVRKLVRREIHRALTAQELE